MSDSLACPEHFAATLAPPLRGCRGILANLPRTSSWATFGAPYGSRRRGIQMIFVFFLVDERIEDWKSEKQILRLTTPDLHPKE
jgi:hypothetical protein